MAGTSGVGLPHSSDAAGRSAQSASTGVGIWLRSTWNRHGAVLVLTLSLWVANFLSLTARNWFWGEPSYVFTLSGARVVMSSCGALLCLILAHLNGRLGGATLRRQIVVALIGSLIATLVWAIINQIVIGVIAQRTPFEFSMAIRTILLNSLGMLWMFVAWSGVWLAMSINRRLSETLLLAANAQNEMLRYQLNPHFMFNTLSALATFISEGQATKAEQIVLNLSRFLRASIDSSPLDLVTVEDEIAVQREYLSIEQLRFEDRLKVTFDLDPLVLNCRVPSFILQPLVENAIKHGVARSSTPIAVTISAGREGENLLLSVRNATQDEVGGRSTSPGVGLQNIRRRLALRYGDRAHLTASSDNKGSYSATIAIPFG